MLPEEEIVKKLKQKITESFEVIIRILFLQISIKISKKIYCL